jgi:hypothetical protein
MELNQDFIIEPFKRHVHGPRSDKGKKHVYSQKRKAIVIIRSDKEKKRNYPDKRKRALSFFIM